MGFQVDERFSPGGRNFVDVWEGGKDYRWLDMYPQHTEEDAKDLFAQWVEGWGAKRGIVYNDEVVDARGNGTYFREVN